MGVRADLHFCCIRGAYIFLDLADERYFMLRGNAAASFDNCLNGTMTRHDIAVLTALNITTNASQPQKLPAKPIRRAEDSVLDGTPEYCSPLLIARALLAQNAARRELDRRPLKQILVELINPASPPAACSIPTRNGLASAFQRTRRYRPALDQCLVRGLAMKRMLGRRNCEADLVIGVALPFAAHCWIQAGTTVLSDPIDTIRPFTPLLAI